MLARIVATASATFVQPGRCTGLTNTPKRSAIGGIRETQEMLDFCGRHNIACDIEVIPASKINEAYERMLKGDVKYRFVIDSASLGASGQ